MSPKPRQPPVDPSALRSHSGPVPKSEAGPRSSRITRPPALRDAIDAHYHVQPAQLGEGEAVESIAPAARRSSVQPVRSSPPDAGDAETYFRAAELLLERGDFRRGVLAAQQAMKLAVPRPAQQVLYARLLYARDGSGSQVPAHVLRQLDEALARDPGCVEALCFKGVLLGRMGRVAEARRLLARTLELDPGNKNATRALRLMDAIGK